MVKSSESRYYARAFQRCGITVMSYFDNITTVSSRALHWCKKTLGRGRYGCVIEQVYVVIEGQQDYACACKSYGSTEINDTLLIKFKFHCGEYYELKHENLLEIKAIICDPAPSTIIPSLLMELMETNVLLSTHCLCPFHFVF